MSNQDITRDEWQSVLGDWHNLPEHLQLASFRALLKENEELRFRLQAVKVALDEKRRDCVTLGTERNAAVAVLRNLLTHIDICDQRHYGEGIECRYVTEARALSTHKAQAPMHGANVIERPAPPKGQRESFGLTMEEAAANIHRNLGTTEKGEA